MRYVKVLPRDLPSFHFAAKVGIDGAVDTLTRSRHNQLDVKPPQLQNKNTRFAEEMETAMTQKADDVLPNRAQTKVSSTKTLRNKLNLENSLEISLGTDCCGDGVTKPTLLQNLKQLKKG